MKGNSIFETNYVFLQKQRFSYISMFLIIICLVIRRPLPQINFKNDIKIFLLHRHIITIVDAVQLNYFCKIGWNFGPY